MRRFFMHTADLLLMSGTAVMGFLKGISTGEHRHGWFLVCLMAAEYLTGVLAILLSKQHHAAGGWLRSRAGLAGLLRKAVMLLVLLLSSMLDWLIHNGGSMFFTAVCWMYIGTEAIALLENLAQCGVPVPAGLRRLLESFSRRQTNAKPQLPETAAAVHAYPFSSMTSRSSGTYKSP